jgi:hypothetical protein
MAPLRRVTRFVLAMGAIFGAGAVGWHVQGVLLGTVTVLAAGCVAVAVLFLLEPKCDSCASRRLNRIGNGPAKCVDCGHVQTAASAAAADGAGEEVPAGQPDPSGSPIPMLETASVAIFCAGVAVSVYAISEFSAVSTVVVTEISTWQVNWTEQVITAVAGLALATVGFTLYVQSLKL